MPTARTRWSSRSPTWSTPNCCGSSPCRRTLPYRRVHPARNRSPLSPRNRAERGGGEGKLWRCWASRRGVSVVLRVFVLHPRYCAFVERGELERVEGLGASVLSGEEARQVVLARLGLLHVPVLEHPRSRIISFRHGL